MKALRLLVLVILSIVIQSVAADGSGFRFSAGLSFIGPLSKEMDTLTAGFVYDNYMENLGGANPFSRAIAVDNMDIYPRFAPAFTVAYEQSFGRVLSVSAGLGVRSAASKLAMDQEVDSRVEYGGIAENSSGTLEISVVHEFTNLVLPIDFKFMLPTRNGGVFLAIGPEVSFLLAAKRTDDVKNTFNPDHSIHTEADIRDDYVSVGLGVGFRLGWEKRVGNHNLLLQTGYTGGLNDMAKDEIITMKNIEFSILELGFRFNTGR
ncbi:MAG: outer membrane beta-barrel protein [Chitinispirillaceae bacterium]